MGPASIACGGFRHSTPAHVRRRNTRCAASHTQRIYRSGISSISGGMIARRR